MPPGSLDLTGLRRERERESESARAREREREERCSTRCSLLRGFPHSQRERNVVVVVVVVLVLVLVLDLDLLRDPALSPARSSQRHALGLHVGVDGVCTHTHRHTHNRTRTTSTHTHMRVRRERQRVSWACVGGGEGGGGRGEDARNWTQPASSTVRASQHRQHSPVVILCPCQRFDDGLVLHPTQGFRSTLTAP